MKQSLERKVTVTTRCTIEESGALIAVGIGQYYFFVSSKEYHAHMKEHPAVNPITVLEDMRQYAYYSDRELDSIYENAPYTRMQELIIKGYKKNAFKALKEAAVNPERVLWMDSDTLLLYPVGSEMPKSTPIFLDYCNGGPDNTHFNLDKAYTLLYRNPYVIEVDREDVPYYNRDGGLEKELRVKVLLPQDVWEKLVRKCRKTDPEFWSCRIKDHLCYKPYLRTDLLGLKPAYRELENDQEQDSDV